MDQIEQAALDSVALAVNHLNAALVTKGDDVQTAVSSFNDLVVAALDEVENALAITAADYMSQRKK